MSPTIPAAPRGDDARAYLDAARLHALDLPATGAAGPPLAPTRTAAVIGGGTMGTGIALALAGATIAVTLIDPDPAQLERAAAAIAAGLASSVAKGRLSTQAAAERRQRIRYAATIDAAAGTDLAIEAVFEDLDVKRAVFAALDGIAASPAVLATNTSTLDIDAIAAATSRPDRVIGLHFFSPASVMPLLEIVRGAATSDASLAAAAALSRQLGKTGVIAGNADGFIGNRMLYPFRREAEFLLEEGALPQDVDRALREFGFAMGPFAVSDLAGLDIGWRVRKRRLAERPPSGRYSHIADRLCELGRFGQKTGAGYYRYAPGSRTPIADPFVAELIIEASRAAGIARRTISDDEICKRCVYALVNEAATILADGIAARPSDVDLVWVYGYGFPAARGGPLYYADTLGLDTVVSDMHALAHVHGDSWMPAPLLARLAAAGSRFTSADMVVTPHLPR